MDGSPGTESPRTGLTGMAVVLAVAAGISALVFLLSLLSAALFAANVLPQSLCSKRDHAPAWGAIEVAACAVLIVVGHTLRRRRREHGAEVSQSESWPFRIVVSAFLGGVALLLGYETFAEGQTDLLYPITWYVRCLNTYPVFPVQVIPAALAMVASLMAGHWLWVHRTVARETDSTP